MSLGDDGLAFRARTLAQAHPLTKPAKTLMDRLVAGEEADAPVAQMSEWVANALLVGYCLRTVEENEAGIASPPVGGQGPDLDRIDAEANGISVAVHTGDQKSVMCGETDRVLDALNHIITTEIGRRHDEWRGRVDARGWSDFERYVTYWVIKGYAIRAAESGATADQ